MSDSVEPSISGFGRGVVGLVIVLSVGFVVILIWGAYSAVDKLSAEAIERAAGQTESELHRFFDPVESSLFTGLDWAAQGVLDPANVQAMNHRFVPLLRHLPQIGSMLIATPEGVEYMLLRDESAWVNRSTNVPAGAGTTRWYRWDAAGSTKTREWTKTLDYDPRERPWFQGAMANEPRRLHWTQPYTFFTTKDPGITVSSRVATPTGELIVAFDVLLIDVSKFTTGLFVSEHGKAVVVTDDNRVLGLPRDPGFATREEIKTFVLRASSNIGVADVATAVEQWTAADRPPNVEFGLDGARWLAGFVPFELGERTLWVAAIVPEADFRGPVTEQRVALIILVLFGIIAATILAFVYTRRYSRQLREAVDRVRDQLGQYRLEKKIGEGGMGSVYRASHVLMRRDVAVKLVRADKVSAEFITRFEREVQMTSRLSHPNTIQIFDYGHTPDGTFYYAMELLNGISLARFIETARRVPEARTIFLLRQICESLREAHEAGLVHRDVKPGNIHICERGGRYDFIKVLDFGLVKDLDSDEEAVKLTGNASFGTPGFVAPEAIRDASQATELSDIYSVGTVAYAFLTGTTLFAESNPVKLLLRQLNEDPEPPSERLHAPVAEDLESLVMEMLVRDPAGRPQSMNEVLDRLDRCRDAVGWTQADARQWWSAYPELFADRREFTLDDQERPTIDVRFRDRGPAEP